MIMSSKSPSVMPWDSLMLTAELIGFIYYLKMTLQYLHMYDYGTDIILWDSAWCEWFSKKFQFYVNE